MILTDDKKTDKLNQDGYNPNFEGGNALTPAQPVVVQYFYAPPVSGPIPSYPPPYEPNQQADSQPETKQAYNYDLLVKDGNSGYPSDEKKEPGGSEPYNVQPNALLQSRSFQGTSTARDLPTSFPQNTVSIAQHEDLPIASFARPPPQHLPYTPGFHPLSLAVNGRHLEHGFPLIPPPTTVQPHPFVTHDVTEGDWVRFLDDLRTTSMRSRRQCAPRGVVPNAVHMGLTALSHSALGAILGRGTIKKPMINEKCGPETAIDLVDLWNHHFFHPRRLEVILMRGLVRLSGQNNPATASHSSQDRATGDNYLTRSHTNKSSSSSSLSSSSSSSSSDRHHPKHHNSGLSQKPGCDRKALRMGYRAERRELRRKYRNEKREMRDKRRAEKRQRRHERKEERRERKGKGKDEERDKTFRLFVVPF